LCLFSTTLSAQDEPKAPADTLLIGYYNSPPFVINAAGNQPEGVSLWLWQLIDKELNIPYRMVRMPLDSILHKLGTHEIDMSLNPLTITSERSARFDFSHPYYISNATVMVDAASPWQRGVRFLKSFFSVNFWRAILALFVVIFIFGFIAWLFERRENPEEFAPGWKGIWSGVWWSAVTMTTVGYGDKSPRSTGGRIVALVWMFAAIIIISGFTASIASSLTVNRLGGDRSDIYAFKEIPLATVIGSATEEWLKEHFFKEVKSYESLEACRTALENDEVDAVAYDAPLLSYIEETDSLAQFDVLPLSYNLQLYAFGFSDKVPAEIREQISVELLRVTESSDWEILLTEYGLRKE
jgi:ABC-type amino acid transport substrate-binding protein